MFYTVSLKRLKRRAAAALLTVLMIIGAAAGISLVYPLKYMDIIEKNAGLYGLKPEFVCAVIHAESKFRQDALSNKGASGLMQLSKQTADWAADEMKLSGYSYDNIHNPDLNILIGCWYLNKLLKQYDGITDTALAAYNAGSGNVSKWLGNAEYSPDGKKLTHIPFGETRDYIKRVNSNLRIYGIMLRMKK